MATFTQGAMDQYCTLLTCSFPANSNKGWDRGHQDLLLFPLPSPSPQPGSALPRSCCLRTVDVLPLATPRLLARGAGCCQVGGFQLTTATVVPQTCQLGPLGTTAADPISE